MLIAEEDEYGDIVNCEVVDVDYYKDLRGFISEINQNIGPDESFLSCQFLHKLLLKYNLLFEKEKNEQKTNG